MKSHILFMKMFFSKNLKYLRKIKKLSQEDVSSFIARKNSAISSYERGSSFPDVKTLLKLCEYFETDPTTILLLDMTTKTAQNGKSVHFMQHVGGDNYGEMKQQLIDYEKEINGLKDKVALQTDIIGLLKEKIVDLEGKG